MFFILNCHHRHQDQSYLVVVTAPAVVAVAVNLQPWKKKRFNLQQMIHTCN